MKRQEPGFFNFLTDGAVRLNRRYEHIILPIEKEIQGARVLDLGSHDGRWPYAIAAAGAREVVGLEGRPELVSQYNDYPASSFKHAVRFIVGDFVSEMDRLIASGERFDLVFCLGVYYHTMHHYRMMQQMTAFKPRLIIIDSVLSLSKRPCIDLLRNRTEAKANAIAEADSQDWIPAGTPSLSAVSLMAKSLGYSEYVVPWQLPPKQRNGVKDYFDKLKGRRRYTLLLRPINP